MGNKKIKPHQKQSYFKQELEKKLAKSQLANDNSMMISLKHLDKNQGDKFEDWEAQGILSRAIRTLEGYSTSTISSQAIDSKFTIYGGFPPKDKTDFKHPNHVPEDARWARIHVTGKQCIIGHVVNNYLYIVFLDGSHAFWKSELKNT